MTSMTGYGLGSGNYGADGGRERGTRRKRLAAMAGSLYRAGATAASEIKESYYQTRSREIDTPEASKITIPGAFPDVAIVTKGNEQMVLFPSYAKRHVKMQPREFENPGGPPHTSTMSMDEQDYWRNEWARHEDEKAIVDVDVRGWIYNPHRGPMTRRNRLLIGLARQLSGIPAPRVQQDSPSAAAEPSLAQIHRQHEEEREQERIAREAKEIERKGRAEEEAAEKGGYSERPRDEDSEGEGSRRIHSKRMEARSLSPSSPPSSTPSSPTLRGRTNTAGGAELSDAELAVANANLMARIAPFMTTPLVELPITLFFYNDTQSQSRTVKTNDSGHFAIRAALDFVPTHVRVLANEDISCTEPVQIIEPRGVSLISDIDDTIKRSNISLGAKEIFRNTFIRELNDLTVEGVRDWYNAMYDLGVQLHYCSNSPWQLYPVLATYFKLAGLPPGSLHLKAYTGMLQGIFEPVAERKKGTLEKIMKDFPERKFLLVGDSGEADLEVYTELAVANPGRIAAIFIRDVTTPEQAGYFDSGFDVRGNGRMPRTNSGFRLDQGSSGKGDSTSNRPPLPPRVATSPKPSSQPVTGDLIDFSEEPEPLRRVESEPSKERPSARTKPTDLLARKPPPRPAKPSSLQGSPALPVLTTRENGVNKKPPTPPQPRKTSQSQPSNRAITPSPLAQMHRSTDHTGAKDDQLALTKTRSSSQTPVSGSPGASKILPPPPPRRRGTPSTITSSNSTAATKSSPRIPAAGNLSRRRTGDSDLDSDTLPPPMYTTNTAYNGNGGNGTTTPPNKKLDLWRRRLQRAQDMLDRQGVALYTWRRGDEVIDEALGIVRSCMEEMGIREGGRR